MKIPGSHVSAAQIGLRHILAIYLLCLLLAHRPLLNASLHAYKRYSNSDGIECYRHSMGEISCSQYARYKMHICPPWENEFVEIARRIYYCRK